MDNFYEKYYSYLVGATVIGFDMIPDEYEPATVWPTIIFEKDGHMFQVEVSKDEEGNGAGFLFGLPHPAQEEAPPQTTLKLVK